MKKSTLLAGFVFLLLQNLYGQSGSKDQMRDVISQYQSDRASLVRKYTIRESDEFYNRFDGFHKDWLAFLKTLSFEQMGQDGKVDYVLLRNAIERDRYHLQLEQQEFNAVRQTVQFDKGVFDLIQQSRNGTQLNGEQTAGLLNQWKKDILQRQRETEKLPRFNDREAGRASSAVTSYRVALEELFKFYNEYDPQFSWWVGKPYMETDSALSRYGKFLAGWKKADPAREDGSGITGNPIGREALIRSLGFEMISYSPEELIDLANKEFAWCESEVLKATREMGLGTDWKAALEKVKNDHVAPGEQPAYINFLAREATDFVEQNNMLTVPLLAKETWRMIMISAEQQKYSPFFLGGEVLMIAYPTSTMQHEDKMMSMRGNNKHFARATVFHEVIPGHHLQQFMTDRYNTQRQAFYSPFWMEGWALYWEMILWDKNFPKSPEDKIGMMFWRMHRCARIIFSLNYHLGKWTPQQCIDFLVDKVGHERANAVAEVRRSFMGGYGPLYQLAYMIGAKQFYALRNELVNSGKMSEKDYHDAVLRNGPVPVEMVRALLTQQSLTRDYKTSWKFIH